MEPTINREKQFECLLECNWRPLFAEENLIRSKLVPLDRKFYDYLLEDGTFIHPKYTKDYDPQTDEYSGVDVPQYQQKGQPNEPEEDIDVRSIPEFPTIASQIEQALQQFNGRILVKAGWKSPKDCKSWLPEMLCTHIEDVFMALKCSEYMSEILVDYEPFWWAQPSGGRLYLVLKEFVPVNKAMEYRCFVRADKLVAVCQRNPETVYPELLQQEAGIKQKLFAFIDQQLLPRMKSLQHLHDYVADIYLPADNPPILLDINPWREFTNSLMFSWEQIETPIQEPLFKIVRVPSDIICEDLRDYNIPSEFAEHDKGPLLQMMQLMKSNPELFY